ncbi:hypothetical protein J2X36_003143 [Methylobacterium sp. BE186]|uniref:hypothetical protein n=1 Tax=Methylobacterium sp. BE186 TaxID=2817715 RepID=UPI00285634F7|nr:hypothetical protein [Methylobacterium sp. BE186]MDR7038379.1 hypothetical protein [Methylobacterium sp. BE186]
MVEIRHRRIFIDAVVLQPGGGDPLAIVERAIRVMLRRAQRNGMYAIRAIMLDTDKLGLAPERDARIDPLARRYDLHLIWQEPCHEGLLLRHFDGCADLRPSSTERALHELARRWPDYRKGIPAVRLAERFDEAAVLRAALGNEALTCFLAEIGFAEDGSGRRRPFSR